MTKEEELLETQAAEASFIEHGGNSPLVFHAVVTWRQDGKLSVISSDKLNVDENTNSLEMVGKNMHGKWKGQWLPVTIMAVGKLHWKLFDLAFPNTVECQ